ncbi:hypothetical protein CXG81DRAFT_28236 [Caulochytrium protostelioides]|uniref:OTU domain-containing protein n=1 Tax=Caulochytrium protostelioides TaxID=1555241 RepID=A0A4P9WZI2_9FUNG|nr:hypothetical protein CXG81DRAFT_28236 [Caulochytrium protostelioides]|eukprot:RKO98979.1 hypothetical protein CXG81DRAFT_28236 [Caulochytrium protostelioides]
MADSETAAAVRQRHRAENKQLQVTLMSMKKTLASLPKKEKKATQAEMVVMQRDHDARQARELADALARSPDGDVASDSDGPTLSGREAVPAASAKGEDGEDDAAIATSTVNTDADVEATRSPPTPSEKDVTAETATEVSESSTASPAPTGATAPGVDGKKKLTKKEKNQQRLQARARALEEEQAQAREEAKHMPNPRKQEDAGIERQLARLKQSRPALAALRMLPIRPDGHCLFRAMGETLRRVGVVPPASTAATTGPVDPYAPAHLRQLVAEHLRQHPDAFLPYIDAVELPTPSDGADPAAALPASASDADRLLARYCRALIVDAMWGGHVELVALSRILDVRIGVVSDVSYIEIKPEREDGTTVPASVTPTATAPGAATSRIPTVYLTYHMHYYGLGAHYNALILDPEVSSTSDVDTHDNANVDANVDDHGSDNDNDDM